MQANVWWSGIQPHSVSDFTVKVEAVPIGGCE